MQKKADSTLKAAIRNWWATSPMTYGATHGETAYQHPDGTIEQVELGSRRFFELADARFLNWNTPLHGPGGPFSRLFPFAYVPTGGKVLEIGCGMGCMAMQWAIRGFDVTAVDLNPVSVTQTRTRFGIFGLRGDVREADAEFLPFDDNTFDYVYSWGVLHHTPNTAEAIRELYRVLKPGRQAGVMLYNRNSFLYRYLIQYQEGFVNMESSFLSPLGLASRYSDGAREGGNPHTWPVTGREVRRDLFPMFEHLNVKVLGTDVPPSIWHWCPSILRALPMPMVKALARRWGWSLWITGVKPHWDA